MSWIALATALVATPAAYPCSPDTLAALTSTTDPSPFRLTCFATLPPGEAVTRPIVIEGDEGTGTGLDCRGGAIGRPGVASNTRIPTLSIRSRRDVEAWSRPRGVRIIDCVLHGNARIWGLGAEGRIDELRASSRAAGHTARTQAAAPSDIRFERVTFAATGSIPLYVGPGDTDVSVAGGRFTGRSVSTAVYLDAESGGVVIEGVDFNIATAREQVAIDGSARNRILDNRFRRSARGGVFLYRNCGEDGVIRHQAPTDTIITGNRFEGVSWLWPRAVVVGSREGRRRYCADDAGYPFGSSIDDGDKAVRNVVSGNAIDYGLWPF